MYSGQSLNIIIMIRYGSQSISSQFIMKTIISLVLLLELALSAELCTSDVYDSYLEAYPMKCGNACDEYKKWEIRMGMRV